MSLIMINMYLRITSRVIMTPKQHYSMMKSLAYHQVMTKNKYLSKLRPAEQIAITG